MPELDEYRISELDPVLDLSQNDLMEVSVEDDNAESGYVSHKSPLSQLGAFFVNILQYVTSLKTGNKTVVGAINQTVSNFANDYDATSIYALDDCVLYDGVLYKCTTAITTAEEWDATHWTAVKAVDMGGGVSDLTNTASGSIATFTDGGDDIPVKSFECEIVAQQAEGTPTPINPLLITGFSQADISVCGKNLFDGQLPDISSTIKYRQIKLENGTYTMSTDCPLNTANASNLFFFGGYATSGASTGTNGVYLNNPRTVTTTDGYITVAYRSASGVNPTDYTFQIEKGSVVTEYEPYKGNTYIVEFGQTIYGGKLVYANGAWAIEATHNKFTFSGSESWSYNSTNGFFYTTINSWRDAQANPNIIANNGIKLRVVTGSQYSNIIRVYVADNSDYIDSSTDMNTIMTNTTYFVYELLTPTIIPITSSTRVKTLSGNNNIFSNTGDVELEYFTENADEIASLIREEQASNSKVKKYQATLSSSQYGWFTFVDENGNALSPSKAIPIHATCISGSNYWKGHFVERTNDYLFKVTDINNSNASNYAPIGTAMSNLVFDMAYIEL